MRYNYQELTKKQAISENSMKSNSPTKFVRNHIDHFIYFDFCKQFIEDFKIKKKVAVPYKRL
ncbi:unnamed protein product [Rhizopus stolonifer]